MSDERLYLVTTTDGETWPFSGQGLLNRIVADGPAFLATVELWKFDGTDWDTNQ